MESVQPDQPETGPRASDGGAKRVIKRYSNRKLYDTRDSRYVTLQQIGELVRAGEDVQIIDNATKEDKTEVTLALILSDNLRAEPRSVPLAALRDLLQERGTRLLSQLREGPIGRLLPGGEPKDAPKDSAREQAPRAEAAPAPAAPAASAAAASAAAPPDERPSRTRFSEIVESSRHTLEEWQHGFEERFRGLDEKLRAAMPGTSAVRDLEREVARLRERVAELERRLGDGS
jgi:polyhydroxyalkanoate synthesis repressor PhaR